MATQDPKTMNKQDKSKQKQDPVTRPGQAEQDDTSKNRPGDSQPYNKDEQGNSWQHEQNENSKKRPGLNPREVPEAEDPNRISEIEDPGSDAEPVEEKAPGRAQTKGL
jgi:hypothetical protein